MKNKRLLILIVGIVSFLALPIDTSAKTIQEFENEVAKYTKELQEKKDKLAKNDQEVAQIKAKIKNIEAQISQAEEDVKKLQEEIDASNKKIEEKDAESKKLMKYFQVVMNDNAYLEYIFGATSIKDMIYRMSVVEQLTDYNDQIMKELEALIKENNRKQTELKNKQAELKKLEADLQDQKERINADSASLKEAMPGLEEQIKSAKANVDYYKKLGCGTTEDIQKCQYRLSQASGSGSIPSTNGFYRPTTEGYISQGYGGYGGHLGVDIGNRSNPTIAIYPIASGQVFAKYYDAYGALVVKIRHNYNGRYIYSTYAHLSRFGDISPGQYVPYTTSIGNMGNTGYSFGSHLHLEITTCDWNTGGGCTWAAYQKSTINPYTLINFPSKWNNR